jgi:hypothetical protein
MALTKTQNAIWEKAQALGAGDQAVALTDGMCAYIVVRIAHDLNLQRHFPESPPDLPSFYSDRPLSTLALPDVDAKGAFERLLQLDSDSDMYFACVAALHKARLKYEAILKSQPIPTLEQVGPRGLLQYGQLSPRALAGLLFWRKWMFDIDNRAGQETGYLFEPVIANAIGGTPAPARQSPVKRRTDTRKGRQVDCILRRKAYELKIRVTIAASGQGRWREELDFPGDCRASGYKPVLVVLDGTPNPKLTELDRAFREQRGDVFIGGAAWAHLDELAGPTMARFLETYVRAPIDRLIAEAPDTLPDLIARMNDSTITLTVDGEVLAIARRPRPELGDADRSDEMPDDAPDAVPG